MLTLLSLMLTDIAQTWHLAARCSEGDVNALFEYAGVWHLMQQWHMRPQTAVGHAVSTDLLRWTRVADALSAGAAADEQCFDGSASLVVDKPGSNPRPMLMIDGGCGLKGNGTQPCMESSGNSTGGVIAFPDDLGDPNLTRWRKQGPTIFEGCYNSAGPSPVWYNKARSTHNLIAIHSQFGEARFEATDSSLTRWKMADSAFTNLHGGGGQLWHELPPTVEGASGPRWPTHILQANNAAGDGRPTFLMGVYDPVYETFTNATLPVALDLGHGVAYGQLSHSTTDRRVLHVSWLMDLKRTTHPCNTSGQLTSFRDVRFDPRLGMLVELPIAEYLTLRRARVVNTSVLLRADQPPARIYTGGCNGGVDLELSVAIGRGGANQTVEFVAFDLNEAPQWNLTLTLPATSLVVDFEVTTREQAQRATFPLLANETALPVRIMLDTRSIEIFCGGGRAVFSGSLYPPATPPPSGEAMDIVANARVGDSHLVANGWEMNSLREG